MPILPTVTQNSDDEPVDLEFSQSLNRKPIVKELLSPLLERAAAELSQRLSSTGLFVSSDVLADLLHGYEQTLARLTNLIIVQRFSSFHLVLNPLWRPRKAAPGPDTEGRSTAVLNAYIEWEEIERTFGPDGSYPELGRLLRIAQEHWLVMCEEIVARVSKHLPDLATIIGAPVTVLDGVTFGISDPHNFGRTAVILRFGTHRILYKPRTLAPEMAWARIVEKLVRESLDQEFPLPRIADFGDYGFMEFVGRQDCRDRDAVARCYTRYGALMGIAHALGTCDLHHENIIVSGEYPVVVDAEPLLRARLALSTHGDKRLQTEQNLTLDDLDVRESVLELGILPIAVQSLVKREHDTDRAEHQEIVIGALSAFASTPHIDMVPCAIGSDDLQIRPVQVQSHSSPNLPSFNGAVQHPEAWIDRIIDGFSTVHHYISCHKDELVGPNGIMAEYASCPVRLLARPTMDYMNVLSRSLSPPVLRSTESRRALIESDLAILSQFRMDNVQTLIPVEIESLMRGDVPRFEVASDEILCAGAELMHTPLAGAKLRIEGVDEFDRQIQIRQIRERMLNRDRELSVVAPDPTNASDVERHALQLVEAIIDARIEQNGNTSWVYAAYAAGVASTMAHSDVESLYEGSAGTAIAIAEAAALTDERGWMQIARSVFDAVRRTDAPESARRGCGMARGLGGLLYAMARVGRCAQDEALIERAATIAVSYAGRLADEAKRDEVLYGRAGLLLSVLALYRLSPTESLLRTADHIARLIIANAKRSDSGASWSVNGGKPLPHVSHGASGIAMALARYAAIRSDADAANVAMQAIEFDDTFWVEREAGWADGRFLDVPMQDRTNWGWCNGRSGALLARFAIAHDLGTSFIGAKATHALSAECIDVLSDVSPGLCCGTAGAIDALLSLPTIPADAHIQHCIACATKALATTSPASNYSTLAASLFSGSAGLAFGLLRAAQPTRVNPLLSFV
ncbi:MAG: type 2 lantipeptide synthetase LanM [Bacteroidetes bacterium]|nr:type 2 lantipeptide synthetase LanM [Bacteroidota bacterium]